MSLSQLIGVIWARKLLFIGICAAVLAAVITASVLLPRKYVAETALVVDVSSNNPLADDTGNLVQLQTAFIATQVDVIASRNVALKVIDDQKLVEDARLRAKFERVSNDPQAQRLWLADYLLDTLSVRASHNGNVLYVQYASSDAAMSSRLANAFADSYIRAALELKVEPARRQAEWFDRQVKTLHDQYELAQQKLADYQATNGVIGIEEQRLDVENVRLEELSNQLVQAQAAAYGTGARQHQMEAAGASARPDEVADVLNSPLLQNLKTELARAEGKFAEVSQRFDRNHPQYQSAAAELAAIQAKVSQEIANARGMVAREANISRQQVANLQRAVEQQRERIITLRSTQNEYAVLKHEADSARDAYDEAAKRNSVTSLQSRMDHTNVAILNRAATPLLPASPRVLLNLALALLFGPLFAAAITLGVEMSRRTVHGRDDLFDLNIGPLLAEVPPERFAIRLRPQLPLAPRPGSVPTLRSEPGL